MNTQQITKSRKKLSNRRRWLIVSLVLLGALVFLKLISGITWRSEVNVSTAMLRSRNRLQLAVSSCGGDPELSHFSESDSQIQVKVVASSTPFQGGNDCLDAIEVQLSKPLNNRTLIDMHAGRSVNVEDYSHLPDKAPE